MIDFPLDLRDDNERHAWRNGRLWLSLDRFERFWPDVGLTLSNGEAVKAMMRGALRVEYAIYAEFRARFAADPDCEDDLYHTDRLEALHKVCFRSIVETAGAHDAECVARWLKGPMLGAVKEWTYEPWYMWHRAWSSLFYQLGDEGPNQLALHYGISHNVAQRLVEIAGRFKSEVDVNRERVEAADQEPLSGWDAIAYADYRWECPEPSPLDGLTLHLRYICFDRAWPEVMRCTPPTDIDALVKWGRANLSRDNFYHNYVAIPDDVRATWHQAWRN